MNTDRISITMDRNAYYHCLMKFDFSAASYEEIATSLMMNGVKEMYHTLVNEADIPTVLAIPNFKIFWCCRCHLVADDDSTGHEHWHALVQFEEGHTLVAYKKRLQRAKMRLNSKTTFKRILCPDHAVEVLRHICCKDGQRQTRRDVDGLMGAPHTHYDRSVIDQTLLHVRGKHCVTTRDKIYDHITAHLSTDWMMKNGCLNQKNKELHNHETCLCARGKARLEDRRIANEKRKNYYKTAEGIATRAKYRDRCAVKKRLIEEISKIHVNKNATFTQESIVNLLNML